MWDDTFVVVTSDHGEQLGNQGLLGKGGMFESSYNIVGIVRDPRRPDHHGSVVDRFTENVDLFPTICEAIGVDVPAQCDGLPAHLVLGRRPTCVVARRDALGIRLAVGVHPVRSPPVALGPPARDQAPDRVALRQVCVRAVRRRRLALLRPRARSDLAYRGHRQ